MQHSLLTIRECGFDALPQTYPRSGAPRLSLSVPVKTGLDR